MRSVNDCGTISLPKDCDEWFPLPDALREGLEKREFDGVRFELDMERGYPNDVRLRAVKIADTLFLEVWTEGYELDFATVNFANVPSELALKVIDGAMDFALSVVEEARERRRDEEEYDRSREDAYRWSKGW